MSPRKQLPLKTEENLIPGTQVPSKREEESTGVTKMKRGTGTNRGAGLTSDNPYNQFSTAVSQTSLRTMAKALGETEENRKKRDRSSSNGVKPALGLKDGHTGARNDCQQTAPTENDYKQSTTQQKLSANHERDSLKLAKEKPMLQQSYQPQGGGTSSGAPGSNWDDAMPSIPSEDAREQARPAFLVQRCEAWLRGRGEKSKSPKSPSQVKVLSEAEGKLPAEEPLRSPIKSLTARKSSLAPSEY